MKTIEFNTDNIQSSINQQWPARSSGYMDQILNPEYRSRKVRFELGENWFRVLPSLKSSKFGWMLRLHVQSYPNGRFVHPRSLKKGEQSVFDIAYTWMRKHHPQALFNRENKSGARLLTDQYTLCWILTEEHGKTVARLLLANSYDGKRGGSPGIGHQLWASAVETDERGKVIADAIDPTSGLKFCVEKSVVPGSRRSRYALRSSHTPAPIHQMLAKMNQEEIDVLKPLEQVLQVPTMDEQWRYLESYLAPETVAEIRASHEAKKASN